MSNSRSNEGKVGKARCIRCGRPLTDPESVQKGMGPICQKKAGGRPVRGAGGSGGSEEYVDEYIDLDIEENGLIMRRAEREDGEGTVVETNVPHLVEHHSPDGFDFGYSGSGAADLALNATMVVLNRVADSRGVDLNGEVDLSKGTVSSLTWESYQDFKRRFVTSGPKDGTISWVELRIWAKKKLGVEGGSGPANQWP